MLQAMVNGLKKVHAGGAFAGPLPRDEMVLMLWVDDPDHPEWVIEWARELSPPQAVAKFQAGYPYEPEA